MLLALVSPLVGCRTTKSVRPKTPEQPVVYRAAPTRSWDVLVDQEPRGRIVHFAPEEAPEQAVYVVRNLYGQDLGWIDSLGRAYRLLPHHREPAWVGTGTVSQGAARILRVERTCTLIETALWTEGDEGSPGPRGEELRSEAAEAAVEIDAGPRKPDDSP